uniref:Uncharacterized protein n=1 Tax=Ixodes ricinus TaxID=34613 RepID=A0A6B0V0L5_IXORI
MSRRNRLVPVVQQSHWYRAVQSGAPISDPGGVQREVRQRTGSSRRRYQTRYTHTARTSTVSSVHRTHTQHAQAQYPVSSASGSSGGQVVSDELSEYCHQAHQHQAHPDAEPKCNGSAASYILYEDSKPRSGSIHPGQQWARQYPCARNANVAAGRAPADSPTRAEKNRNSRTAPDEGAGAENARWQRLRSGCACP